MAACELTTESQDHAILTSLFQLFPLFLQEQREQMEQEAQAHHAKLMAHEVRMFAYCVRVYKTILAGSLRLHPFPIALRVLGLATNDMGWMVGTTNPGRWGSLCSFLFGHCQTSGGDE